MILEVLLCLLLIVMVALTVWALRSTVSWNVFSFAMSTFGTFAGLLLGLLIKERESDRLIHELEAYKQLLASMEPFRGTPPRYGPIRLVSFLATR